MRGSGKIVEERAEGKEFKSQRMKSFLECWNLLGMVYVCGTLECTEAMTTCIRVAQDCASQPLMMDGRAHKPHPSLRSYTKLMVGGRERNIFYGGVAHHLLR